MRRLIVMLLIAAGLWGGGAICSPQILFATACGWTNTSRLCLGDRNCDCSITIDEITACIAASQYSGEFCSPQNPSCAGQYGIDVSHCDRDCNWNITIDELVAVVNNAQTGCTVPCYSGLNYPVGVAGNFCTAQIFKQLHCSSSFCNHASCPSCP